MNDITKTSATGAVDTNVQLYFPLETGSTISTLIPKPHSDGRHNSKGMSPLFKNCTCGTCPDMHNNGHVNNCVQELDTQSPRRRRGSPRSIPILISSPRGWARLGRQFRPRALLSQPWPSSVPLGRYGATSRQGPWRSTAARASRQRAVVALFAAERHWRVQHPLL